MMDQNVKIPMLNGTRVLLRALRFEDASLLALYAGDLRVAENTVSIAHPYPPGAAENFIERAQLSDGQTCWAIDASPSEMGSFIGTISAREISNDTAEIGYWVAPILWGKGFASEAVAVLLEHLASQGKQKIVAKVFQENKASAQVLLKNGFSYGADDMSFSVARGKTVPQWVYEKNLAP